MQSLPKFSIIAVQVFQEGSTGQKVLKSGEPYYFYKGYRLSNEGNLLTINPNDFAIPVYDDFLKKKESLLHISVSAIVGANGSGKSCIVEYILRILNNFSAAFMLDAELLGNEHHLRFIKGVYGSLWFISEGQPYEISIQGEKVSFHEYEEGILISQNQTLFFKRKDKFYHTDVSIEANRVAHHKKYCNSDRIKQLLRRAIFYTYISNYSLYAYNPHDFYSEWNENEGRINRCIDERGCWLDGLFHKNDGYQAPIVLTPYRVDGNININKERILSDDRLLTLLLRGSGFSSFNGHLSVESLAFTYTNKKYDDSYTREKLGMSLRRRGFRKIRNAIADSWKLLYGFSFSGSSNNRFRELALNYLTCKTLKAVYTYQGEYGEFYDSLRGVKKWIKAKHITSIKQMIKALSKDDSHITTKIRQTLAFLETEAYYKDNRLCHTLQNAIKEYSRVKVLLGKPSSNDLPVLCGKAEDCLPPHFFRVIIKLKEQNGDIVEFHNLSSGERQQIYAVSSILYHLSNIDSVHLDNNAKRISYKNALVILEEIELYYHPKFQQNFLLYLLDGLAQVRFKYLQAISIMLVTHSPFVLSDIPSNSILALQNGEPSENLQKTFGANIHDMLKDSFFMDNGFMGAFADWAIKEIIQWLKIARTQNGDIQPNDRKKTYERILMIDEPIVRGALMDEFHSIFERASIEEERARIVNRLAEIDKLLKNKKG